MDRSRAASARRLILTGLLSLGASALTALPPNEHSHLERALAVIEYDQAGLSPATSSPEPFEVTMARLADEVRADLPAGPPGPASVEALNRAVFARLGVRASVDLKDPSNLLPSRVLQRRQGYCVGIAALYLVLAERLNLPIHAVATPSHVFLRFDDGSTRINIETLQRGANVPDEQYIREQKIPAASLERGIFMRDLTADEFLAQVHNNLGVIYSERQDYVRAALQYEEAIALDARLPAAYYNYGNDLLREGEARRAARRFSKSLRLYPTDVWALNNRGLAYLKTGKRDRARRDFEEALRIDPGFEQARKNLEAINKGRSAP